VFLLIIFCLFVLQVATLIAHGVTVDLLDRRSRTPLYVALAAKKRKKQSAPLVETLRHITFRHITYDTPLSTNHL
jgi:hypothetical protein